MYNCITVGAPWLFYLVIHACNAEVLYFAQHHLANDFKVKQTTKWFKDKPNYSYQYIHFQIFWWDKGQRKCFIDTDCYMRRWRSPWPSIIPSSRSSSPGVTQDTSVTNRVSQCPGVRWRNERWIHWEGIHWCIFLSSPTDMLGSPLGNPVISSEPGYGQDWMYGQPGNTTAILQGAQASTAAMYSGQEDPHRWTGMNPCLLNQCEVG